MVDPKAVAKTDPKLPTVEMGAGGVNLRDIHEAERFCKLVVASGMAPKSLSTPAQVFVAVETGLEAGLSPMQALRSVYVVNGLPAWKGEAALALIRSKGRCRVPPRISHVGEGDDYRAEIIFQRTEDPSPLSVAFSVADAKKARLWGKSGPWTDYAEDMLVWRAVSRLGKQYFADVLLGLAIVEEMRDYPTSIAATKADPPTEPDPLLAELAAEPEVDPETGEVIPDYIAPEEPEQEPLL
jgi:hypothetical protein